METQTHRHTDTHTRTHDIFAVSTQSRQGEDIDTVIRSMGQNLVTKLQTHFMSLFYTHFQTHTCAHTHTQHACKATFGGDFTLTSIHLPFSFVQPRPNPYLNLNLHHNVPNRDFDLTAIHVLPLNPSPKNVMIKF